MRLTSPSRRAAGLLAVSTIGLSTALFSVTGVASAGEYVPDGSPYVVSSATDDGAEVGGATGFTVPEGYCSVMWDVAGASGGASGHSGSGANGGAFSVTTDVTAGQQYSFALGANGGDATAGMPGFPGMDMDHDGVFEMPPMPGTPGTGGSAGAPGGAAGTSNLTDGAGGGGGGLTSVSVGGAVLLSAFGGDGGTDSGVSAVGGAGAGNEVNQAPSGFETYDGGSEAYVSAFVLPCDEPETGGGSTPGTDDGSGDSDGYTTGAPDVKWVDGDVDSLSFQLWITTVSDDAPVTGVEYSLDEGAWTSVDTQNAGDFQYSGTITGLDAGTHYSVRFRFTTADGATDPSVAYDASTLLPGPTGVQTTVGVSSVTVTWKAPVDDADVTGYHVAISYSDGESGGLQAEKKVGADVRTATLVVPAGRSYQASVASVLADGSESMRSDFVSTDVVPAPTAPTSLPTADGPLTTDGDSTLTAGESITLSGDGYLPHSTVTLVIYSTPTVLGTADVDADGHFSATVSLPADLPNGDHHLVAAGLDVNGDPYYLVTAVTVTGGVDVLAFTGFSALPYAGAGALALLAGGGLLVASRRRQAA